MAAFYTVEDDTGDLPLEPFAGIHAGYMEEAKRILKVLEACEWKWTINEILEQPADMLDTIVTLRATGLRMKQQVNNKKSGKF